MIATILGVPLFHEVAGEGTPLLFVHGLGGTSNVWAAQRAVLPKTCQVVTLDLPGSGRSGKADTAFSMDRWADQLIGLADHLKLERVVLVGHSMSTILVQKTAAKHPARVRAAILCGPMTELPAAGKEAFRKRKQSVETEGMAAIADQVTAGALTPATREANAPLAGLFREMLMSNDPVCYAAQCQALLDGSAKADQPKIQCPMLVLVGDQDVVTPLSNAKAIAAAVPTATVRIVPATAHATMLERPELFNALVMEFVAGLK